MARHGLPAISPCLLVFSPPVKPSPLPLPPEPPPETRSMSFVVVLSRQKFVVFLFPLNESIARAFASRRHKHAWPQWEGTRASRAHIRTHTRKGVPTRVKERRKYRRESYGSSGLGPSINFPDYISCPHAVALLKSLARVAWLAPPSKLFNCVALPSFPPFFLSSFLSFFLSFFLSAFQGAYASVLAAPLLFPRERDTRGDRGWKVLTIRRA